MVKQPNVKKDVVSTEVKTTSADIDINALMLKIKELEEQLNSKTVVQVPTVQPSAPTKNKFKFIPDNTKVRIQSNIGGKFIFGEDRGKVRVFFQIDGFGESAVVSYEELRIFVSSKPTFVKKGHIAIVDVYSDADITLEDVINDLRLEKIYFSEDKINPILIESLFSEETSEKEFENKLNNSMDMAETVMEAGHVLYRRGLFNNNSKMNSIRQIFRKPNLFK